MVAPPPSTIAPEWPETEWAASVPETFTTSRIACLTVAALSSIDPPAAPPPGALVLTARGPYVEADERALLQRHRIEVLVTKNAGGTATVAKLAAAADLGVQVVIVARPALPAGLATVPTAQDALRWLDSHAGTRRSE